MYLSVVIWFLNSCLRIFIFDCINPQNEKLVQTSDIKLCHLMALLTHTVGCRYDSRCRVALKRVARWLGIPLKTHAALENTLASFLLGLRQDGSLKPSSKSISRWVKVGAAAVGGGAAIALTGAIVLTMQLDKLTPLLAELCRL